MINHIKQKSFYLFAMAVCLAVLFAMSSQAAAADRDLIIVRGDIDYPPCEFLENDKPAGFNVELLEEIARVMDMNIEIRLGVWSEVRSQLESGQIDMLCGMYYSPERDKLVDFSKPHSFLAHSLFVKKGSPIKGIEDARGKRIIVQKGDIMNDFLVQNQISDRIIYGYDPKGCIDLLESGKGDCALISYLQGNYIIRQKAFRDLNAVGEGIYPREYCFAVKEGDRELIEKLNEGLRILRANGTYNRLYEKWYGFIDNGLSRRIVRYVLIVLAVISTLLAAAITWSAILKYQVRIKTRQLKSELERRKKIERDIAQKNQELESLLYVSSHDLKSPLVNLGGFSSEMVQSADNLMKLYADIPLADDALRESQLRIKSDIQFCAEQISKNSGIMARLIDGTLKVSRFGVKDLDIQYADVRSLIDDLVLRREWQLKDKTIQFAINDLPRCYCDSKMIRVVLECLIDNAIKFTDPTRKGKVEISGRIDGEWVEYSVRDNGIGIDEKYQAKIFDLFHRLDPEAGFEGQGLGLTMAQRIIARHGGNITVESQPGAGSTFYFRLPDRSD